MGSACDLNKIFHSNMTSCNIKLFFQREAIYMYLNTLGAAVAEWLESLTHDHLPLTPVGLNPTWGENLSCEEAFQLACDWSVVLLGF